MKKFVVFLLCIFMILGFITGCDSKDISFDSSLKTDKISEENASELKDDNVTYDKFFGTKFIYHSGSGKGEITISFDNDVTKNTNGFTGHCTTYFDDGSGGKRVSYSCSNNELKINLLSDSEIDGLQDKDIATNDFFVYDNFLVRKNAKAKDTVVSTKGNFDILINDYMEFNADGMMTIKEYKIGNIVVMKENYYSGTYIRNDNLVTIDSYCPETNHTAKWYLFIDDYGEIYTEVYQLEDNDTSLTDLQNSKHNNTSSTTSHHTKPNNMSSTVSQDKKPDTSYTEQHVHNFTIKATCEQPAKCVCGETSGVANGHQWEDATCTTPKQCKICNKKEGQALGHSFNDKAPFYCSTCEKENPNALSILNKINVVSVDSKVAIKKFSFSKFRLAGMSTPFGKQGYSFTMDYEIECLSDFGTYQMNIAAYNADNSILSESYVMYNHYGGTLTAGEKENLSKTFIIYSDSPVAKIEIG